MSVCITLYRAGENTSASFFTNLAKNTYIYLARIDAR